MQCIIEHRTTTQQPYTTQKQITDKLTSGCFSVCNHSTQFA